MLSTIYNEKIEYEPTPMIKLATEVIPEESFSKINKIKPLLILAEEVIASELVESDFETQREVLNSISCYPEIQREVMSWMLIKSSHNVYMPGFYLKRGEFYKAYESLPV